MWIGGTYISNDPQWITGETWNYSNWLLGFPVVDQGFECIVHRVTNLQHGKLRNVDCSKGRSYVCEIEM